MNTLTYRPPPQECPHDPKARAQWIGERNLSGEDDRMLNAITRERGFLEKFPGELLTP